MSSLNFADSGHTADGPVAVDAIDGHAIGAGVYLTDEVFLFRVVALVEDTPCQVELEDCYGLDVAWVPAADLYARRLRVVTPV
jgi:hypothetical protein